MTIDRPGELRALLAFYVDAGVDAVLDEGPVNRFTAEPSQPRPSQIPAGGPPSPHPPAQAREGRVPTRAAFNRPGDIASNARSHLSRDRLDVPPSPDAAIMAARRAAAGATSLDALRTMLERFEGCGLRLTAKQLVFADGNPQARVMFVGEAPGREEDIAGLPFVGPSARAHDGGDRARSHHRLHRQRDPLASTRKPHADAPGKPDLPAFHQAPDRTRRSRYPGVPRGAFGGGAARHDGGHPQIARPLACLSYRPAGNSRHCHLPPGLSVAHAAGKAVRVAGLSGDSRGARAIDVPWQTR